MLCEEPRRIGVSRIRCYSFAPALPRPVARMARGTGHVRRDVVPTAPTFRHQSTARSSDVSPDKPAANDVIEVQVFMVPARRIVWLACRGVAGALRRFLLYVRAAGTLTLCGTDPSWRLR
eukprot:5887569-Prymnesium_polylepis.1